MDMEDQSDPYYHYLDLDGDDRAIFDIPEEVLESAQDFASEHSSADEQYDDDSSEFDYEELYGPTKSGDGNVQEIISQLQEKLLKGYTLPPIPGQDPLKPDLSRAQRLSLHHYFAWVESNGTVKAYNSHARVLSQATGEEILSLHRIRQLALDLAGLTPQFVEMCPKSCQAYTGDFESDIMCGHSHKSNVCNEPHYLPQQGSSKAKLKPRATMLYMPIMPMIQAYYANADTSREMRHRDNCLKATLNALAVGAGVKKSEFSNSYNHVEQHYKKMGLFRDGRDTALSISSDGAQLTMKKQSNMWLLIVVLLNLPPEMCYKANNVIIPLAIPGPLAPSNIESFIYPLFEEMAMASVGMWTWDAVDSSYFVLRAFICAVKGDMLRSAKLSGMAGSSANYGDRFSLVKGASPSKGAKPQYYPISPPQKDVYIP